MSSYDDDDNPTLTDWRRKSNGQIKGAVSNHPRFEDGTYIYIKSCPHSRCHLHDH